MKYIQIICFINTNGHLDQDLKFDSRLLCRYPKTLVLHFINTSELTNKEINWEKVMDIGKTVSFLKKTSGKITC